MVADARMFSGGSSFSRRGRAVVGGSLQSWLADGSLGGVVLKMAEDLAMLGAAMDLALAADEIDRLDDAAVDSLLIELGLIADPLGEMEEEPWP